MSKAAEQTGPSAVSRADKPAGGNPALLEPNNLVMLRPITSAGELRRYGLPETIDADTAPKRGWLPSRLFMAMVLLPLLVTAIYNFVIASDRFVSTASFVVRETSRGGVISIGGSGAMTRSDDDSFAIAEFLTSRDAVDWLIGNEGLRDMFAAPDVDLFSRFPSLLAGHTNEEFYKHFSHYVSVDFNPSTGISTIEVQGFSPDGARRLTVALLNSAESLINNLNARARNDAVTFAEGLVRDAERRMKEAQEKMTAFRNAENILDPDSEVAISNLLLTELLRSLGDTDAQIAELLAATPDNPRLGQLRLRRDALTKNIDAQRALMAGSNESFALKMEGYDRVRLERDLMEKSLVNAVNTRDVAEREAQRGHLYLERVVAPNSPDRYGYPLRYWNMVIALGLCLGMYWIVRKTSVLFAGARS